VDGFRRAQNRSAGRRFVHELRVLALQVHLDAAEGLGLEGLVVEALHLEIRRELAVDR